MAERKVRAKAKAPSTVKAEARTISLFTKRTDLEDQNARDGSAGETKRGKKSARARGPRKVKWVPNGNETSWVTHYFRGSNAGTVRDRIERLEEGRYEAWSKGTSLGIFPTLASATNAAELAP